MGRTVKAEGGSKRSRTDEKSRTPSIEQLLEGRLASHYRLRLYVAGNNFNSFQAVQNVEKLCREHLQGRADLEIVDLYQQPRLAVEDRIVAAPCLLKLYPGPPRRFIGDLSDLQGVVHGLSIRISPPASST